MYVDDQSLILCCECTQHKMCAMNSREKERNKEREKERNKERKGEEEENYYAMLRVR